MSTQHPRADWSRFSGPCSSSDVSWRRSCSNGGPRPDPPDVGPERPWIGLYNAERTIVDAFRLRHLYGDDQAIEALRRHLRTTRQPSNLLATAHHFPTAEPMLRRALEILR